MAAVGFELKSYERLLRTGIEAGYKFVSFAEIGKDESQRSCLLRHDVDLRVAWLRWNA